MVMRDRGTDVSRGFGFVEYLKEDEMTAAIKALNGTEYVASHHVKKRRAYIGTDN